MNEKLVLPNKRNYKSLEVFGIILSISTLMLLFNEIYPVFFRRTEYYNRKEFLKWLGKNKLPKYEYLQDIRMLYCRVDNYAIYYNKTKNNFFIHDRNSMNSVVSGFTSGAIDKRRNNLILKHLKNNIKE